VDDDRVECPNATFSRIQDAVDAASPGATIRVCKGNYAEQVAIRKPLTIAADGGAVLIPGTMQQNTTSLLDGSLFATAIIVADTTDVTIEGLTLDGANNGVPQCSPRLFGIVFQNASGGISQVAIRNFKLGTGLGGCQSGTGILVQSGGGGMSSVEIEKSTIHDFQKNGITANEVGTRVSVHGNVVTGIGPTTGTVQNGIQIGFGAGGAISKNTVTNNLGSPCTAVDACTAVATNILVTQSDGVEVTDNGVGGSQVGIFLHGNEGLVARNETFASSVFDGIRLEGDGNRVRHNQVFSGAQAGIFIAGNNNVVEHNKITEAAVGILKDTGSVGNVIRFNQVFDSPVAVQDPASVGLAGVVSPERWGRILEGGPISVVSCARSGPPAL